MACTSKTKKRKTVRATKPPGRSAAELRAKLTAALGDVSNPGKIVALFDELATSNDELATSNDELATSNDELTSERDKLRQRVDHLSRLLFGRRSEKLRPEELGQLALAFGATEEQAAAADPEVPSPDAPSEDVGEQGADGKRRKKKKRKHPGRTKLSPALERQITEVPVPDDERGCQCCGAEMQCIGHLDHERVEYVPAKLVVHVERREKLGCKACRGDAVTAERKDPPAVGRRVGASLLAHLVESKCDDALPIYRQRDQLGRLGFEVPLNTLYSYWHYVTDLLRPVADTTMSVVLGDPNYVALDDTKLMVLDKNKRAGIYRGHLWCFTGSGPLVAYAFTKTWEAQEVVPWIAAIDGFIQCDDYKGYSSSIDWPGGGKRILVPPERRLGCTMHVRRRFYKAFKQPDRRAAEPMAMIRALYEIEAEAKTRGLDADGRTALRAERSLPILGQLESWVDDHEANVLPKSVLGHAIGYAKHQRPFIRRCFEDGRFEIDNGHTERQIKEPVIGRKNFLFTGSADAAKRLAGAYTLVQSCRNLGFPSRDYLLDVIDKLENGWPVRRIRELVPDRWAELHRAAATDELTQNMR